MAPCIRCRHLRIHTTKSTCVSKHTQSVLVNRERRVRKKEGEVCKQLSLHCFSNLSPWSPLASPNLYWGFFGLRTLSWAFSRPSWPLVLLSYPQVFPGLTLASSTSVSGYMGCYAGNAMACLASSFFVRRYVFLLEALFVEFPLLFSWEGGFLLTIVRWGWGWIIIP